jgi:hypothetical protein
VDFCRRCRCLSCCLLLRTAHPVTSVLDPPLSEKGVSRCHHATIAAERDELHTVVGSMEACRNMGDARHAGVAGTAGTHRTIFHRSQHRRSVSARRADVSRQRSPSTPARPRVTSDLHVHHTLCSLALSVLYIRNSLYYTHCLPRD